MIPTHDITAALREALKPPTDGSDMKVRVVTLTPDDARNLLKLMAWEGSRKMTPAHVDRLADAMINNEFIKGSQITFVADDAGDAGEPVLIDGQQRLEAAVIAGWTGPWVVRCLWGEEYQAQHAYIRLDTSQKERTPAVIGHATGLAFLSDRMVNRIVTAARYQNLWSMEYELPSLCNAPPIRDCLNLIYARLPAFEMADNVMAHKQACTQIQRRVAIPMVMAVIVATLHAMPQEAEEFWNAVVANGEGVAANLRSLLIEGKPQQSGTYYMARLAAHGWNQRRCTGRVRMQHRNPLRVSRTSMKIPAP